MRQASLTQAESDALVRAVEDGAVDEARETIAGGGPAPSSMSDYRATRLAHIVARLKRPLRRREVELVFRVTPTTARSIVTRMHAMFPDVLEEPALLAAVSKSAHPEDLGRQGGRRRYRITFDDEAAFNAAYALFNQRGLIEDVRRDERALTFDVPQRMGPRREDPLEMLGIKDRLP
jgi:hypothetical protein